MVVASVDWGLVDCRGCYGLDHSSRVYGWSATVHYGVEPVVCVSGVGHGTDSAVRLHQAVLSLYYVTVTFLPLALDVTGMGVINTVIKAVFRVCLKVYLSSYINI
jgi:hypothetical protein